jgi:hypothetical protein
MAAQSSAMKVGKHWNELLGVKKFLISKMGEMLRHPAFSPFLEVRNCLIFYHWIFQKHGLIKQTKLDRVILL